MLFRDIVFGQYLPVRSPVHQLDPRTKFMAVAAVMVLTLVVSNLLIYLLLVAWLGILAALARLPLRLTFRNLRSFFWLFLITFCIHLLFTDGQPLPLLGWGTIEGAWRGLFFCLRVVILVLSAAILTLTTSPLELTDGLERLLTPLKWFGLSPHALALMLVIALRFIPTFIEEANNIQKAQMARGANFTGSIIRRARSFVPLLVPLFLSAFRRADELAVAMEARNYQTDGPRTSFHQLKFTITDYGSMVFLIIFFGACVLANNWLPGLPGS
jgi:energy-coupling factor transport system permease protein